MAIKNEVAVFIDGINRTSNLVLPFKYGNFLDERLDESIISLRAIKKETFEPFTSVEVVITQTEYFGVWDSADVKIVKTKKYVKKYFTADDLAAEVTPGTGIYNHDLYCIELTKISERTVVDTMTVTNDLGRTFNADTSEYAEPVFE